MQCIMSLAGQSMREKHIRDTESTPEQAPEGAWESPLRKRFLCLELYSTLCTSLCDASALHTSLLSLEYGLDSVSYRVGR